uniref:Protein P n=1 Tax=Bovine ephemeral fever virus TaxID=11303 RepID=A0A3G6XM49_BEFV|nr:protein P' [Bovine ephemeral fever virus]AZB86616.1 protein P' [Bovine ephemeral fever virus]AZB87550.1 protein P' [Bovine ephemeral fever virus]AZM32446.1 protein P' [Bovine ephemeral fever virus]AZM32449.1 protein P' [Bovine ephemeral fever virus]
MSPQNYHGMMNLRMILIKGVMY